MIIIVQLAVLAALVTLGTRLLGHNRRAAVRSVAVGLAVNALAVIFFLFALKKTAVYGEPPTLGFAAAYGLTTITFGGVVLFLIKKGFDTGILVERTHPGRAPKTRSILSFVLGAVLGFLIGLFFFVPLWFGKTFGDIPADHFMFLLTEGGGESTREQDLAVLNLMVSPSSQPPLSAHAWGRSSPRSP
nr:hypothetical protein [Corynebacterium lactis]